MKKSLYIQFLLILTSLFSTTSFTRPFHTDDPYVLLIMLFNETDPIRLHEYKTCFIKNKKLGLINTIYVWYDQSKDDETNELLNFVIQEGAIINYQNKRVTYGEFLAIAADLFQGRRIILSNADIFFNKTLLLLEGYNLTNKLLAITRWNIGINGALHKQTQSSRKDGKVSTQDTWIFRSPLVIKDSETIEMGIGNCDGGFAWLANKTEGLEVINPYLSIQCCHLHRTSLRHHRNEGKYYHGEYELLTPSTINGYIAQKTKGKKPK